MTEEEKREREKQRERVCVCTCVRDCVREGVCVWVCMCTLMNLCSCVGARMVFACVCMCACVCERVCVSVWVCERLYVFVRIIFSGVYGMGGKNNTTVSSLAASSFPFSPACTALFPFLSVRHSEKVDIDRHTK